MTQAEIGRLQPKKQVLTMEESLPSLTEEVLAILGYKQPEPSDTADSNVLLEALTRLEMPILNWRDVFIYQTERRHEVELLMVKRDISQEQPSDSQPNTAGWQETKVKDYRGLIPAHVLHKAVEIVKACPEVELGIVHLQQSRDPFLVASVQTGTYSFQRARYFIEVWDEPGFEGI
jgi:hypothetical protein